LGGGESAEEGTEHLGGGCVGDEGGEGERGGAGVIRREWDGMKDGREDKTTRQEDIRYHGNYSHIYRPLVLMRHTVQCISLHVREE